MALTFIFCAVVAPHFRFISSVYEEIYPCQLSSSVHLITILQCFAAYFNFIYSVYE